MARGSGKGQGTKRTKDERSPTKPDSPGNESVLADGAGPSAPKRQLALAAAFAEASQAPPEQNAAASAPASPGSAFTQFFGVYGTYAKP